MPKKSDERRLIFTVVQKAAIQGELGSNSHLAALQILGPRVKIVACGLSAQVVEAVLSGKADAAVLPIENSLHGSVAEHYDLLLDHPLRIDAEASLRIEHNIIAAPGVRLDEVRHLLSHPVALSQCRRFLASFGQAQATPFHDTAGSVRHVVQTLSRDSAGIAPRLAAEIYGGKVLLANVEDHPENFTRFHLLRPASSAAAPEAEANKLSVAFAVEHQPGTLVRALEGLAAAGANLTKIESRPVPGRPWEYVFFVDLRYDGEGTARAVMDLLARHGSFVKELGRYRAA